MPSSILITLIGILGLGCLIIDIKCCHNRTYSHWPNPNSFWGYNLMKRLKSLIWKRIFFMEKIIFQMMSANMKLLPFFFTAKLKIATALSDLVIYTKIEKFRSFHHSRLYQQFNESNSIGESQARKLSKLRGKFLRFT